MAVFHNYKSVFINFNVAFCRICSRIPVFIGGHIIYCAFKSMRLLRDCSRILRIHHLSLTNGALKSVDSGSFCPVCRKFRSFCFCDGIPVMLSIAGKRWLSRNIKPGLAFKFFSQNSYLRSNLSVVYAVCIFVFCIIWISHYRILFVFTFQFIGNLKILVILIVVPESNRVLIYLLAVGIVYSYSRSCLLNRLCRLNFHVRRKSRYCRSCFSCCCPVREICSINGE